MYGVCSQAFARPLGLESLRLEMIIALQQVDWCVAARSTVATSRCWDISSRVGCPSDCSKNDGLLYISRRSGGKIERPQVVSDFPSARLLGLPQVLLHALRVLQALPLLKSWPKYVLFFALSFSLLIQDCRLVADSLGTTCIDELLSSIRSAFLKLQQQLNLPTRQHRELA